MSFYLCGSCGHRVRCSMREDEEKLEQIKEQGDCPNYLFRSSTKYKSTFTQKGQRGLLNWNSIMNSYRSRFQLFDQKSKRSVYKVVYFLFVYYLHDYTWENRFKVNNSASSLAEMDLRINGSQRIYIKKVTKYGGFATFFYPEKSSVYTGGKEQRQTRKRNLLRKGQVYSMSISYLGECDTEEIQNQPYHVLKS